MPIQIGLIAVGLVIVFLAYRFGGAAPSFTIPVFVVATGFNFLGVAGVMSFVESGDSPGFAAIRGHGTTSAS
jgi:hypothetical protein